jgi:RecB family exonuclease
LRIDQIQTASPVTGAVRQLTDDLLREVYLAPLGKPFALQDLIVGGHVPWSESFKIAPVETIAAVEDGLLAVMRATRTLDPSEINLSTLPEGRARTHLTALIDLWHKLDGLPAPLSTWSHVLRSNADDALEALPILDYVQCPFADPVETALAEALQAHHGTVPLALERNLAAAQGAFASGALGAIQAGLGKSASEVSPDETIEIFGLRDPRQEAEFAAARVQSLLDAGIVDTPAEVGLLFPDDVSYERALTEAFERVGLPLSGLPSDQALRDTVGELMTLILALLERPAPRTAIASVYITPSMPWPRETGLRMAREQMDYGWSKTAAGLDGTARELLDALRPCTTPEQFFGRLSAVAKAAPAAGLWPKLQAMRTAVVGQIDWPLLHRIASPKKSEASGHVRYVEGVSLFTETALPWRPVRQLIVLGLAGRTWPRPPASNPFFTESEIILIREKTGLHLVGRQQQMARGVEFFRRQLCAAKDAVTLLVPACTLAGDKLAPSTGLSLITHMMGLEAVEKVIRDIHAEPQGSCPVATVSPAPVTYGGKPSVPASGFLHLGSDLLRLRKDDETGHAPQSPSRLEALIVSPLAWLLDELGAKDRTWGPETLDVMTLGTLLHHVMEVVFPEGTKMPNQTEISNAVPAALDDAIRRYATWLSNDAWGTERQSLLREAYNVTSNWGVFLNETQAEVLHNEISLAGDHGELRLRGNADCLLKLPDGRILIIDHKRSSSSGRRDRMAKGWDLQVALYQAMLERPSIQTALTDLVAQGADIVTAYHTMLDGIVLSDAAGSGLPRVEHASIDASKQAMEHLAQVVSEVGGGTVLRTNNLMLCF